MKYLRNVWTLAVVGLLLAACSSADPPSTDTDIITSTRRTVDVSYTLEARFAAHPRGDVNRDRRLTGRDLNIVFEAIQTGNVAGLSDFQLYQADYNCDGVLSIEDIEGIQARVRNDKAPPEVQVCEGNSDDDRDDGLVLISNIGDLPFNGLEVTGSAGIRVVARGVDYLTFNPTTFAYTVTADEGVTSGSITISAGNITTVAVNIIQNIAEVVASRPELSVLLEAVLAAGLAGDLTADGELTVFAPNNDAFVALLESLALGSLDALIKQEGIEFVTDLLRFHIVPGTLSAADLLAQINDVEGNTISLETLTGSSLTVSLVNGNLQLQDDIGVLEANLEASNGIIHIIDSVLSPSEPAPQQTIAEIATADADLSALVSNLNADQVTLLSDETQSLTVLAPVNDAFTAASALLATLSPEQVAAVINYHVLVGEFFAEDVIALDGQTLPNTDIAVSVDGGNVFLQGAGNDAPIQIIATDIDASNGVVHLLNGILLPANLTTEPGTIAEIATADADLSSLVGALNADQVTLLGDDTQSLTVLAPVNAAFEAASDLLGTLSAEQIATVINYHVLMGEFLAADVIALDGQTLPDSDIAVSVVAGNVFLQGAGNDTPVQIIATDIDASNGVIHKLDGILLPADLTTEPGTIAEIATADADLSSLVGALNADQVTLLSDDTQNLTVLAPVNDAFTAASALLATLSPEQVAAVINYHVLAGEFFAEDVIALNGQTLPNTDIAVSVDGGNVFLQGAGNDAPVQIIATDIDASNGVVHKLNGVLLPSGLTTGEATISGRVFNDTNQNNSQDAGETGLENFTVSAFVDTNANGSLDAGEVPFSATTDADGNYTITGLDASATYVVTQQLPFGWRNVVASDAPGIVTQIIGGGDADIAEYPFKVAIMGESAEPSASEQSCGATLISNQWVLSAAHCEIQAGQFVLLNTGNLESGAGQAVEIVEVINHPLYQDVLSGYDVTLLRLAERVVYPTVPLVTADTIASVAPGTPAIAVGWGTTLFQSSQQFPSQIQEVDLPIVSQEECLARYAELGDAYGALSNTDTQICAGRPTGGIDSCQGDSGGALLVRNATNTGWLQAGVTSHGFDCGAPAAPGVYARMDNLASWIFENASEVGGTLTIDLAATANATANFGNVSTLNPQEDAGDLFFLNDFDIDPTPIRNVPANEAVTFSWNISNTNADAVCTLSYVSVTSDDVVDEFGDVVDVDVTVDDTSVAIATVDPCAPGDNNSEFAAGFAPGNYNVTLTVAGENKTRTRTLYLTVGNSVADVPNF